ncbi:SRPBCC domain-containing protein [Arthrobacter sp. zg-Y179]|uniref:SRPBCC domain-containing protein n=1 Tax=Arthrobacter sp. zg-Y179 TaxID=2894188 RepID=UPI001E3311A5|nr:SRPBCC domain-containing protein [Arthrobacter sp. zg-Y179]MCC9174965.1 SRPBCC domain-containing protein [Arthrobacter sp. zg-Y179]
MDETIYRTHVAAPPGRVWAELTATDIPRAWMWDSVLIGSLAEGSSYAFHYDGEDLITGSVLVVEAPVRLSLTFNPQWDGTVAREAPGVLEYTLQQAGDGCDLTVRITGLHGASATSVEHDTPGIYAGLKTLLEAIPVAGHTEPV